MQCLSFAVASVSDIVTSSWIQITTLKQIKSHDSHLRVLYKLRRQCQYAISDKYLKYPSIII